MSSQSSAATAGGSGSAGELAMFTQPLPCRTLRQRPPFALLAMADVQPCYEGPEQLLLPL